MAQAVSDLLTAVMAVILLHILIRKPVSISLQKGEYTK